MENVLTLPLQDDSFQIARSILTTAAGRDVMVSTVRLPLDHHWEEGQPLWYETMVFAADRSTEKVTNWLDLDCKRYTTEEQARVGHDKMIARWLSNTTPAQENE